MNRFAFALSLLVAGLSVASCTLTLTRFTVPPRVMVLQEFEVGVEAVTNNTTSGDGACVLQLPLGFVVVGSKPIHPVGQPAFNFAATRDNPALLQNYTAEPGHYLASFSGRDMVMSSFKVILRAPASPTGPQVVKISLAGSMASGGPYQATDPVGVTAFANITAPLYAPAIQVLADPPTPFALETNGLLGPGTLGALWWGAAMGDIDGDGNADMVFSSGDPVFGSGPNIPTPRAWLSRPGSAWVERSQGFTSGPVTDYTFRPAFGDFDHDGFADIAVSRGQVFFGNGGASWQPALVIPGLWAPADGVATGDIDGDGIDDVAFGSSFGALRVFKSNGDRTFTELSNGLPTPFQYGFGPLLLRDVTGDGHCDLIAADGPRTSTQHSASVWSGDGQGNWTRTNGLPAFSDSAVGDVDGDGRVDLILALSAGGVGIYSWQVGAWVPSAIVPPVVSGTVSLALLDYDRDAWLDLVVAPTWYNFGPIQLWHNQAGASFANVPETGLSSRFSGNVNSIVAGDVDGDSFPDLVAACVYEQPTVWRNTGSGLSPYGSGCAGGTHTMPHLGTTGTLRRGSSDFTYVLHGQPNSYGVLWVGTSQRYAFGQPILPRDLRDFGAPGCFLLAAPEIEFFLPIGTAGQVSLLVPIPNDPALARQTLFAQGTVVAPGANPLGWLFTGGLAAKIP